MSVKAFHIRPPAVMPLVRCKYLSECTIPSTEYRSRRRALYGSAIVLETPLILQSALHVNSHFCAKLLHTRSEIFFKRWRGTGSKFAVVQLPSSKTTCTQLTRSQANASSLDQHFSQVGLNNASEKQPACQLPGEQMTAHGLSDAIASGVAGKPGF